MKESGERGILLFEYFWKKLRRKLWGIKDLKREHTQREKMKTMKTTSAALTLLRTLFLFGVLMEAFRAEVWIKKRC